MLRGKMRGPVEGEPHYLLAQHLIHGGRVLGDDRLNHAHEILDLERLGGDAAEIRRYGWRDLRIEERDHAA